MNKIISVILILIIIFGNQTFVFAETTNLDYVNSTDNNFFVANKEQLKLMNSLINKGLTTGEVFSIVCPDFLDKVKNKNALFNDPFDKDVNPDKYISNLMSSLASIPHYTKITNYGNSIKFWSAIDTQYIRPYMNMEVRLYSRSTGEISAYAWAEKENVSGISCTGIADPSDGTYYCWAQAKWLRDSTCGCWFASNATCNDMYYNNPYQ